MAVLAMLVSSAMGWEIKLNVQEYPRSFNAYDSLAEAYMKNNQNELAIANFKESLQLNPENENARKMLEKLGVH
jgi:cytochrome c-type biogenesis protein CcmH/NrfG